MTAYVTMFGPDYWDRSHTAATWYRQAAPAHQAKFGDGTTVWVINGFDDAAALLRDPRLSKDVTGLTKIFHRYRTAAGHTSRLSGMFTPHALFTDPPRHQRLRRPVANYVSKHRVAQMRPTVEQIAAQLLDRIRTDDPVDLIEHFAFPLSLTVSCTLLGVPVDDGPQLREWTSALMEESPDRINPASEAMERYVLELVQSKRDHPGDDLLSALITGATAEPGTPPFTDDELLGTVFLLLVAGHETTTNAISNTAVAVLTQPGLWQTLATRPDQLPRAVEETLRYDPPVRMATHRYTLHPIVVGDIEIPADEIVLISLQSACRDPRRFDRPDHVDLDRTDLTGHLAFGHGIHYCLGAALARLEGEIALGSLTRWFPRARLAVAPDQLRRRPETVIVHGWAEVPVLLEP